MKLYIPTLKRVNYISNTIIQRELPKKGNLVVKVGDKVVPFTKIGRTKLSKHSIRLPKNIKIASGLLKHEIIYKGDKIGRVGFKKQLAPYNGSLIATNNEYVFLEEEHDFWVLSGLWGVVEKVSDNQVVSIKTQTINLPFAYFSGSLTMGELVVFPNPSELLDVSYLEHFSKNTESKVIYVGDFLRKPLLDKAIELGITTLISGSTTIDIASYAKKHNINIALFSGFGELKTPTFMFNLLKDISSRHVFLSDKLKILQIPVPEDYKLDVPALSSLMEVQPEMEVYILDKAYFGQIGKIDRVQDRDIYVKLSSVDKVVVISSANLFALI